MKTHSRFSYFRDKLQVFFLGFLLGIVLGGGFFLLKVDSYVKELSFYKSLMQKDDREKDINDLQPVAEKPKVPGQKVKKVAAGSTETPVAASDSLGGDSVLPVVFNPQAGGDDIVIRKDELLSQKTISIVNLDIPGDSANARTASDNTHFVTVEYWKSPLNYRGYKYSRNRLVLFGFEEGDVTGLYRSQGGTYLKSALGVFRIGITSDFRQLERISDESLIARMQ